VASLGRGGRVGRTAPGDTIQGVTPEWDLTFVAELTKKTGQTLEGGEGGNGEERSAKRLFTFSEDDDYKGRQFFKEK